MPFGKNKSTSAEKENAKRKARQTQERLVAGRNKAPKENHEDNEEYTQIHKSGK